MRYDELDIQSILFSDENRKIEKEQGLYSVTDLKDSIERYGQLQPIIVMEEKDGYRLIAGERRTTALKLCGFTTVKAIIVDTDDPDTIRRIENSCRKNLHPLDEAEEIADSIEKIGIADTAVLFGVSPSYCRKRKELLKLTEDFKHKFLKGDLKLQDALILARATEEIQKKIYEKWDIYKYDVAYSVQRFDCDLSNAKFDVSNCSNCAFNTSVEKLLFDDYTESMCVNPDCFIQKKNQVIEKNIQDYIDTVEDPIYISENHSTKEFNGKEVARLYDFKKCDEAEVGSFPAIHIDGNAAGNVVFLKEKESKLSDYTSSYELRQKVNALAKERFINNVKAVMGNVNCSDMQLQKLLLKWFKRSVGWAALRGFSGEDAFEKEYEEDFLTTVFTAVVFSFLSCEFEFEAVPPEYEFLKKALEDKNISYKALYEEAKRELGFNE